MFLEAFLDEIFLAPDGFFDGPVFDIEAKQVFEGAAFFKNLLRRRADPFECVVEGNQPVLGVVKGKSFLQAVDRATEPVITVAQRLFHPFVFDGDPGNPGRALDKVQILGCGLAGFAVIHGKGPQNLTRSQQDRLRPTRPEPRLLGLVPEPFPVGVGHDVFHDDRFAGIGGGAAGPGLGPDPDAVDGLVKEIRQVGRRPGAKALAVFVQ